MNGKKLVAVIALLLAFCDCRIAVWSQEANREGAENSEIETDRDSFTASTNTVERGRWVIEASHSFIDNRDVYETHSFPELLMRRGLNDWMELRMGWNYEIGGTGNPISGNTPDDLEEESQVEEESRMLYGAKLMLTDQAAWLPESAMIVHGYTPTGGESNLSDVAVRFMFGWSLRENWKWDFGTGYATSGLADDRFNTWTPSTVIRIPIGERWKAHAEYFGVMSDGREKESVQHFFSPGAHYLINRDLEIGIRVGWGLNEQSPNFFSNFGVGWRF